MKQRGHLSDARGRHWGVRDQPPGLRASTTKTGPRRPFAELGQARHSRRLGLPPHRNREAGQADNHCRKRRLATEPPPKRKDDPGCQAANGHCRYDRLSHAKKSVTSRGRKTPTDLSSPRSPTHDRQITSTPASRTSQEPSPEHGRWRASDGRSRFIECHFVEKPAFEDGEYISDLLLIGVQRLAKRDDRERKIVVRPPKRQFDSIVCRFGRGHEPPLDRDEPAACRASRSAHYPSRVR